MWLMNNGRASVRMDFTLRTSFGFIRSFSKTRTRCWPCLEQKEGEHMNRDIKRAILLLHSSSNCAVIVKTALEETQRGSVECKQRSQKEPPPFRP